MEGTTQPVLTIAQRLRQLSGENSSKTQSIAERLRACSSGSTGTRNRLSDELDHVLHPHNKSKAIIAAALGIPAVAAGIGLSLAKPPTYAAPITPEPRATLTTIASPTSELNTATSTREPSATATKIPSTSTSTATKESTATVTASHTASPTPSPTEKPSSTATSSPTKEPPLSPTPSPTEKPKPTATVEKDTVGNKNIVEYLLGDQVEQYQQVRQQRWNEDPSFRERMPNEEVIRSDRINFLYLGIDQTRDRDDEFYSGSNPEKGIKGYGESGKGRSDAIMFVSIDTHTLKTTAVSFPRDLLVPDQMAKYKSWPKINTLTSDFPNDDPYGQIRQVFETAISQPIDGIIKTNIDFMKEFLSDLFPDGLEIDVPYKIVDNEYPGPNYSYETVVFEKGKQRIKGANLVKYNRTRHSDSAFGREMRGRQTLNTGMIQLLPDILKAVVTGDLALLDKIIVSLEQQKTAFNFFSDEGGDLISLLKALKQKAQSAGVLDKAKLGLNSTSIIKNLATDRANMFKSFGLTSSNGAHVDPSFPSYVLVLDGSNPRSPATKSGNYLAYWSPFRKIVEELIQ